MAGKKMTVEDAKSVVEKFVEETSDAVKAAAKVVEAKVEEVKAEAAAKVEVTEAAEATEEKETEKKKPGRKPGSKNKAAAKTAKKEATTPEIFIQFGAAEASVQNAVEMIKAQYVEQGHRASSIKSLKVYLKPEDNAAYYVINEKVAGKVDLF